MIRRNGLRLHFTILSSLRNQIVTTKTCENTLSHCSTNIRSILFYKDMITLMGGEWLTTLQPEKPLKMKHLVPCTLCRSAVQRCMMCQTTRGCNERPETRNCFRSFPLMTMYCRIKRIPLTESCT